MYVFSQASNVRIREEDACRRRFLEKHKECNGCSTEFLFKEFPESKKIAWDC